ncbi:MAG: ABC transporter ATP-binding protein [Armatimonadota bacterium]
MKVISVDNVSKKFILTLNGRRNLADVARGIVRREKRKDFWALEDVSFDVEQGEAIGIIGHNGAGKSTMLKLLTRIMQPTSGRIRTRGRVSALIEVGAGFHPEMTGRENVYLNGSILGMTRAEIDSKFDEIVAFAELEQFIDTPVKRYSSGMYARLGFAVAAHVDPEILIVDEVLSVGDAAFQERCSKRMQELRNASHTVVFVSHNMGAVAGLCDRVVLLEAGRVKLIADPQTAVKAYHESVLLRKAGSKSTSEHPIDKPSSVGVPLMITDMEIIDSPDGWTLRSGDALRLRLHYVATMQVKAPRIGIHISDRSGRVLVHVSNVMNSQSVDLSGTGVCEVVIDSIPLVPDLYTVTAKVSDTFGTAVYDDGNTQKEIVVLPPFGAEENVTRFGLLWCDSQWRYPDAEVQASADRGTLL